MMNQFSILSEGVYRLHIEGGKSGVLHKGTNSLVQNYLIINSSSWSKIDITFD